MVRILKSESSTAPRIDVVSPGAALPGGDVEVQGANLGAVATTNGDKTRVGGAEWRRPIAMLGDLAAPVLLSRAARLTLRVPEEAESGGFAFFKTERRAMPLKCAWRV